MTFVPGLAAAETGWKAVVLITARFNTPAGEITKFGTGFFVDHDGLIVTVDHLLVYYHGLYIDSFTRPTGDATQATDIAVFSPYLRQRLPVASIVLGDKFRNGKWVDMALIRVRISDEIRSRLYVLEFSHDSVNARDEVYTYLPRCPDADKPQCLTVQSSKGIIKNTDPHSFARSFETEGLKPPSCSGGPVLNTAGLVVGLCSVGTPIPGTEITYAQSNIPGVYLQTYGLGFLPPSAFFEDPIRYAAAIQWELPSSVDIHELFGPEASMPSATDEKTICGCLCKVLVKNPSAIVMLGESYRARRDCLPPECAAELADSAEAYLTRLSANRIDVGEFSKSWYTLAKTLFEDSEHIKFESNSKRASFFRSLGYVFTGVATNKIQLPLGAEEKAVAVNEGLNSLGKSLEAETGYIFQRPTWMAMATLFDLRGDVSSAQKARLLGERYSFDFESPTNTVETAQQVRDTAGQQIDWAIADIKASESEIRVIDILLHENRSTLGGEDLRQRKKGFESRIRRDKAAVTEETKKRNDAQTFLDDTNKLAQDVIRVSASSSNHSQSK